jgi:HTH-type transcriptional regulator / antitoxin HigA
MEMMRSSPGIANKQEYAKLLSQALPHVIHTEEENERYISALEHLLRKRERTDAESRLAELLSLLIEDFEEKHYALGPAEPLDILRHLMETNNLRQVDLLDVFGTASIASEVLSGKRDFAKSHIERLSHRFNVSPEVFFRKRDDAAA